MMQLAGLLVLILGSAMQNTLRKIYSNKAGDMQGGAHLFNLITAVCTLLVFVALCARTFVWHVPTVIYGAVFGGFFAMAVLFGILAMREGALSLTSLIISYSLIVPAVYGLLFLNEPLKWTIGIGMAFLAVSLFLINYKAEPGKITKKWIVFVLLTVIGNGGCATMQKLHQVAFPGMYQNEFVLWGMSAAVLTNLLLFIFTAHEDWKKALRYSLCFGVPTGLANAAVNAFVMILATMMSASVLFPLMSGGSMVVTFSVACLLLKEKLTLAQIIGLFMGIASIVFLSV